jgi:hypothetical protein
MRLPAVLLLPLLAIQTLPGIAQQNAATVPPEVRKLLDETMAYYQSLNALHLKTHAVAEPANASGLLWNPPLEVELRYQKPNLLYLALGRSASGQGAKRELVVGNGKQMWRGPAAEAVKPIASPPSLAKMEGLPAQVLEIELLAGRDPFQSLIEAASQLSIATDEKVGESEVDTLVATVQTGSAPAEGRVRVSIGRSPRLVRRIVVEFTMPDAEGKPSRYRRETVYDLADTAPKFTAAHFVFPLPTPSAARPAPAKPANSGKPAKAVPPRKP